MTPVVRERAAELERLCRQYSVARLELFGSAAADQTFSDPRDLDFMVEFQPLPFGSYANAYFGLLEDLEQLFERPVDLVVSRTIKNPYFMESIERTRTLVYAA